MGAFDDDSFDPKVAALIRHKVRRLIGNYGFRPDDEEDLRQELSMYVVVGMRRHDPTRSSSRTFADRIVTSKIASIIKHASAQKRDARRVQPIDDVQEPSRSGEESLDLRLDVAEAVATLPEDLRPVAALFMEHGSEAAVIRAARMTREMVRGRRRRIAGRLRGRGLD